ncbi:MAG: PAS domain S-box protein [Candidatus Hermodarchaeota archaeon]
MKKEKLVEEGLRETEELFRLTFEKAAVGIAHVSPDGKFIRINQKFCNIVKYSEDEMLSITFQEITHPDDLKKDLKNLERLLKGDIKTYIREKRYICKDKTIVWVNLTVSLIRNSSNKPKFFIAFVEDITNRKTIENALAESESRYRNIIENTTDVLIVTGFDGKHIYVSPNYYELLGRTPEQIDKLLLEYLHPEDRLKLQQLYKETFQEKYAVAPDMEFEFRIQHQEGHYIWVSSITKNYYDEEGKIIGVITSLRDINKRKEAEKNLTKSENKYRHLFESSPYIIGLINEYGTIIDCNSSISNFFALLKEDLIGRTIYDVFSDLEENKKLITTFRGLIKKAYSEHQGKSIEFKLYRSRGDFVWVYLESSFIEIDDQILIQFIMQDITEKKVIEESLRESEFKFRTIAEQSFMGIVIIQDGFFKYFNDQVTKINGYSREETQNWEPYEFLKTIYPDDRQLASEQVKKKEMGDNNILVNTKYRLIKKSGEMIWIENYSKSIIYEGRTADLVMSKDITDEVQADLKLKESELKFRTIAEQSFLGISIIQDGIFKYYNDKMTEINGYSRKDIQEWGPYEYLKIIHPDDRQEATEEARKNEIGDPDFITNAKYRIITKSGEVRWTESFSKTINYEGRTADLIMSKDITDEVQADLKLKESELKFRTITEQSFMGIIIIQDGLFKYFNKRAADVNGYSVEEINEWEPYEFMKLIHPDDKDFILDQVKKKQKGEKEVINRHKYRLIKKSGEIAWMDNYSKTISFNGRPADLVITEDITEKILSEQQLKDSELKFRKIFEANPSGMHFYDINPNGELVLKDANPAADEILKTDNQQKIGLTLKEAFPTLIGTDIPSKYRNLALKGGSINWRYKYNISEEHKGIFDIYAFQTAPGSVVASFIDITDRIETEERLKEINKLKTDLLRRASHELKTPLTSINGATDLLLTTYQEDFSDKTVKFLNIIKNGSKRLENLIKDLLNVSRLQTQTVEIDKHREDIVNLMRYSIKEIELFALERKIDINFDRGESVYINVDKNKILQVFVNILMNAIKYTPPLGKVSVSLEVNSDNVDIFVKDTGIGFTEEEKKGLFKQFGKIERFGHGFELNTEGSGLGLYISKELVELHSGELLVESEGRNKGSTFIIRLPIF